MMDADLLEELEEAARGATGVHRLQDDEASKRVELLAQTYVRDGSHRWWWQALATEAQRLPYGDEDGLSKIMKLFEAESSATLVITDDSAPPWPVFSGSLGQLISLLRNTRFCEYFLAASDGSWIVFDTHMNELVMAKRSARQ